MNSFIKLAIGFIFYELVCLGLIAQNSIELRHPSGKNTDQQSPFDKISVIDNRFDSIFFTYLNGDYPIRNVNFKNGFSNQISNFLESMCRKTNTGSSELILTFDQFRIANTTILDSKLLELDSMKGKQNFKIRPSDLFLRKGSQVAPYSRLNGRELILVSVDLFHKTKEDITRIASVRSNIFLFYENFSEAISQFLTKLYEVAELAFYKNQGVDDKSLIEKSKEITKGMETVFYNSKVFYTSDSLQINIYKKWANYPIINRVQPDSNGFFRYYLLFLTNDFAKADIKLQYDPEDSTYIYLWSENTGLPKCPLILVYSQDYFLRIFENRYIKIYKKGNTFHFHIPYTYPNAYEWLSRNRDIWKSLPKDKYGSKNMFTYPDRLLSEGKEISKIKDEIKKDGKTKDGNFKKYRECFFDMDTGDVIFY